jgi:IS5 family transposase
MSDAQLSFANTGFEARGKVTKRAAFLNEMNKILPWKQLCETVGPYHPTGEGGRPSVPLERMLRVYFLQQWFTLSDVAVEEAIYDSTAMRAFLGIDLGTTPVPDSTTLCKFRHRLEKHDLGKQLFETINTYLAERGFKVGGGTIVDATIIAAPSSTKNEKKERDPEMHQTKKGNQWYFGMKAHIGVDSTTKLVHTVVTTAANAHDSTQLAALLHGEERRVWGDSAYTGKRDVIVAKAPHAKDFTNKRAYRNRPLSQRDEEMNSTKSSTRSRVEHIFGIIKGRFGFRKVRYRGLMKNTNALHVLFGLANLLTAKNRLLRVRTA